MSERGWKFVLVGSVVLNVFMLGAIGGGAYPVVLDASRPAGRGRTCFAHRIAFRRGRVAGHAPAGIRRRAEGGTQGRSRFRAGRARRPDHRAGSARRAATRSHGDRRRLDRTRAADTALRAQVERSVVDFAATLTPDERAKFVDGLRRSGNWRLPPKLQKKQGEAGSQ